VDATLLATLGPYVSRFAGDAGKRMLARSPEKPLSAAVVNRPKTGFSVPMASWSAKANDHRSCSNLPLVASAGTPWARDWAGFVIESTLACA